MTGFDIYSALGNVGEDMLEESETSVRRLGTGAASMLAAAACIAVFAVGIRFTLQNDGIEQPAPNSGISVITTDSETRFSDFTSAGTSEYAAAQTSQTLPTETSTIVESGTRPASEEISDMTDTEMTSNTVSDEGVDLQEIAVVPGWEDLSELERYIYLQYNGTEYSITMEHFDEDELSFLLNGEIYGIDENDKRFGKPCGIYKIKNVSDNYMLAVPTADGNYTGFINWSYKAASLEEYLKDIDFWNRYPLAKLTSGEKFSAREHIDYTLPDLRQVLEKLFLSNRSAAAEINPPTDSGLSVYIIGEMNDKASVYVYEHGYIRILNKFFYVGEEYTEEFSEYVEKNADKSEPAAYTTVPLTTDYIQE